MRVRRGRWLEVGAAVAAVGLGLGLGWQMASPNWSDWITYVGVAFHVAITLMDPLLGLLLYCVTAPFARFVYLDIDLGSGIPDLGLSRVVAATLVLIFLANVARGRWRFRGFSGFDIGFFIFFAAMLLSAPNSAYGGLNAMQATFDAYFVPFALYLVARHLVRDDAALWKVLGTFSIIGVVLACLTVREQLTGEILFNVGYNFPRYSENIRKVVGLLGSPTFMGMALAIVLPVSLYLLLRMRKPVSKGLAGAVFGAILLGLFMTYSRGAWLGGVLSLVVMGLLYRPSRRLLVPMGGVGLILTVIFWNSITSSAAVTERLTAEASVGFRVTALQIAFDIVRSNPLFGVGFNTFGEIASQQYGWTPFAIPGVEASVHNTFLFILTSAGLLGFLPYLFMSVAIPYAFWRGVRRSRQHPRLDSGLPAVGLAAYVAYLAPSLTVDMIFGFFVNTLLFVVIGTFLGRQEAAEQAEGVR